MATRSRKTRSARSSKTPRTRSAPSRAPAPRENRPASRVKQAGTALVTRARKLGRSKLAAVAATAVGVTVAAVVASRKAKRKRKLPFLK